MTALQTGFSSAYYSFINPTADAQVATREERIDSYAQSWAYYNNRMFSRRDAANWTGYLARRELYKHTRLIYNPVPSIVNFYVDNLWQPSTDASNDSLVISVADATPPDLVAAIAQIDQWTNFLTEATRIKTFAAATGNCLVEIIDDLDKGKVRQEVHWAGNVTDIELSYSGDVLSFQLEYDVKKPDANGSTFRYKKIINKQTFSYFKDDVPFVPEGKTDTVEENPYGFCPAVWIRHSDSGSAYGQSAAEITFNKVDELAMLAAHCHDGLHKGIEAPQLISTAGQILPITGGSSQADGTIIPGDPRLDLMILKAENASVHSLTGDMQLDKAFQFLDKLDSSFAEEFPEVSYFQTLREFANTSGVARQIALTPAQNRLDRAAAGYNQQLIKLRQMQIAIAGWRTRNGWINQNDQQRLFAPFNLESYADGNLDFILKRSLLIERSVEEVEALRGLQLDNANKATGILPLTEVLEGILNYSQERREELIGELKKENSFTDETAAGIQQTVAEQENAQ